jgi:hypothetical protein
VQDLGEHSEDVGLGEDPDKPIVLHDRQGGADLPLVHKPSRVADLRLRMNRDNRPRHDIFTGEAFQRVTEPRSESLLELRGALVAPAHAQ